MQQFLKKTAIIISCTVLLCSFTLIGTWKVPEHTVANFNIHGLFGKVNGTLQFQEAKIDFDKDSAENSKMDVTLDVSTINTGIGKRDRHLKNDDFFEVAKYPLIVFHSTAVKKISDNNYSVTGNLTIKDVTRSVEIPFTFEQDGTKGTFKGEFTINRMDYKVGEKQKMGIGKKVHILLNVPVEHE